MRAFCVHAWQKVEFGALYDTTEDMPGRCRKFDVRCLVCERILHVGRELERTGMAKEGS